VAYVLALSGRRREAEAIVAELEARARERYVTPVALCIAHLGLKNVDQVFHWLDRAYEDRRGWLTYMKVDPIFDVVRDEARYIAFLKRMTCDGIQSRRRHGSPQPHATTLRELLAGLPRLGSAGTRVPTRGVPRTCWGT